jgi:hypothetical protein
MFKGIFGGHDQHLKRLQQFAKRPPAGGAKYLGPNKRALAMLPGPLLRDTQEMIRLDEPSKLRQLFISLEAEQSTGCLRITSPKSKSRSAMLIFHGRVLGCLYGKKQFGRQSFGKQAYEHMLLDMSHKDNVFDAYLLNDEIVLAASALFHGEVFNAPPNASTEEVFESAYNCLIHTGMPGCILIGDENNLPVATVYVFNGKIVGVYAPKDGWVSTRYETGAKYVAKTHDAQVAASILQVRNIDGVMALTFSLSGIGLNNGKLK